MSRWIRSKCSLLVTMAIRYRSASRRTTVATPAIAWARHRSTQRIDRPPAPQRRKLARRHASRLRQVPGTSRVAEEQVDIRLFGERDADGGSTSRVAW